LAANRREFVSQFGLHLLSWYHPLNLLSIQIRQDRPCRAAPQWDGTADREDKRRTHGRNLAMGTDDIMIASEQQHSSPPRGFGDSSQMGRGKARQCSALRRDRAKYG
jgi:hypothetical protein